MSYLQPDTAPSVHIEMLPTTATAVDVSLDTSKGTLDISITTWASGKDMWCDANGDNDRDYEDFQENYCYECEYHNDEVERDAEGISITIGDEEFNSKALRLILLALAMTTG